MKSGPLEADHVFDGGDMDCGSGLILLIREHMQRTPEGGVLELRSSEPSVVLELPPWCSMTGHLLLKTEETSPGKWRHFLRRGKDQEAESAALIADKNRAQAYEWRARAALAAGQSSSIYARNFSWKLGQPASFEEKDAHPSCLEAVLGALLGEMASIFATCCKQRGLGIDELEANGKIRLHSVLAHLGLEPGDPSIASIDLTVFVTSPSAGADLREAWQEARLRAPLWRTLDKSCACEARMVPQ